MFLAPILLRTSERNCPKIFFVAGCITIAFGRRKKEGHTLTNLSKLFSSLLSFVLLLLFLPALLCFAETAQEQLSIWWSCCCNQFSTPPANDAFDLAAFFPRRDDPPFPTLFLPLLSLVLFLFREKGMRRHLRDLAKKVSRDTRALSIFKGVDFTKVR